MILHYWFFYFIGYWKARWSKDYSSPTADVRTARGRAEWWGSVAGFAWKERNEKEGSKW